MYNEELKQRYIDECIPDEGTKNNVAVVLKKAEKLEKKFNKDLSNFNDNEADALLYEYNFSTKLTAASRKSILVGYVDFAIANGFVPTKINVFALIDIKTLDKYVNKQKEENKLILEEDVLDIVKKCDCYQDKALILAPYEGIHGNKLEDMINLKIDDISKETNQVKLKDKIIDVTPTLIDILIKAHNETEYKEINLIESRYIFRTTIAGKGIKDGRITQQGLMRRLANIKKDTNYLYVSFKSLFRSGIKKYIDNLEKTLGRELKDPDYVEIARKYGYVDKYSQQIRTMFK